MSATETAQEVVRIRSGLGLKQEEFAARLGASTSSVQKWERGAAIPHPGTMRRIRALAEVEKVKVPAHIRDDLHVALDIILSRAPMAIIEDVTEHLVRKAGDYGFQVWKD
jgi:transcriptional regulator with XRE-family HTH domain